MPQKRHFRAVSVFGRIPYNYNVRHTKEFYAYLRNVHYIVETSGTEITEGALAIASTSLIRSLALFS